jgi:ATP/maltotriose-dependent transcriptional regulator MalT
LTTAYALGISAIALQSAGDPEGARQLAGRTSEIAADRRLSYWTSVADALISWLRVVRDGCPEALHDLRRALAGYRRTQGNILRPYLLGLLAEAEQAAGFETLALDTLRTAERVAHASGARFYQPMLSLSCSRILAVRGDSEGAAFALRAAHRHALSQRAFALAKEAAAVPWSPTALST